MNLIKNISRGKDCIEGEVFFGLFNKYITLYVEDDNLIFADKCAIYLNSLSSEVVEILCRSSINYCNSFLAVIGEPLKSFSTPLEVLELIYPSVLIVPYPERENELVVHLELNCEWESEHGMEWVIRNNKVLYVGAFNGEDPWSEFDDAAEWNYA